MRRCAGPQLETRSNPPQLAAIATAEPVLTASLSYLAAILRRCLRRQKARSRSSCRDGPPGERPKA